MEGNMQFIRGACTNLLFPDSRNSLAAFREMAAFLKSEGVGQIECYHDGEGAPDQIGEILQLNGLDGVFIAVIPSKEQKLHACALGDENRKEAVSLFQDCMDRAADGGMRAMMINSGAIQPHRQEAMARLADSIERLFQYRDQKRYDIALTLEPCDTGIYACQQIGTIRDSLELMEICSERGLPMRLTMDSAHTAECGEDFVEALEKTRRFCNHIHFANCFVKDPASKWYGDMHLDFDHEDSEWDYAKIESAWPRIQTLYSGEERLMASIEVLCRDADPFEHFRQIKRNMGFFFP